MQNKWFLPHFHFRWHLHAVSPSIVIVNLDPRRTQEGVCILPVSTGLPPAYGVQDLLDDKDWAWTIGRNYVRLGPGKSHVLRVDA